MDVSIKRIDLKEFHELGFLQEVNRQFFHPLGLALEMSIDDDGNYHLGGVWDYRDDPEGMVFFWDTEEQLHTAREKAMLVAAERKQHSKHRKEMFSAGSIIQPLDYLVEEKADDDK